jgi:type IV pilus assembly protein PilN
MLRINLLPVRKIKQQFLAKQQIKFFGIIVCLLLAVLILWSVLLYGTATTLENENKKLEAKKQQLAKILKEIEDLEKKKELIKKQTAIVEKLKKTSALSAHVLNEVANITPNERMWLTSLDQTGNSMKLDGMALDNQTVAEYMQELVKSKYISNVTLTSSALANYAGRNLKRFSLSCTVSMGEEENTEQSVEETAAKK